MEKRDCTVIGFSNCRIRIPDRENIAFVPQLSTLNHCPNSSVSMSIRRISETTSVPYPDNSILVASMTKYIPLCQHVLETSDIVIATPLL